MKTRFSKIAAVTLFSLLILVGSVYADVKGKNTLNLENTEELLLVENWMINDNYWETGKSISILTTTEETLELENWMTNNKVWKVQNDVSLNTEIEGELELEFWMTNENIWNK